MKDMTFTTGEQPGIALRFKRRLTSNLLLWHNIQLLVATFFTGIFSYLFHPIVGHFLGNVRYGDVISINSLFATILIPTQIIIFVVNKFTADLSAQGHIDQVNYLLQRGMRYGLLLGALVVVVLIILSPALAGFLRLSSPLPVVIASIGLVLAFAPSFANGALQGRQEFAWFGITNFLGVFLKDGFTVALILVGLGINGVLLAGPLSGALIFGISLWALRHVLRGPQTPIPSLKPLFTYSLTSALALAGTTLLGNLDVILAKHFLSQSEAGYYAALTTIGKTVLWVSGSLVGVMFPKVTSLYQQNGPYRRVLAWTMAGVFILSTCMLFLFWLFPGQAIGLIFHAPPQVTHQLVWYGSAMLLFAMANVLLYYFLSLGRMSFVPILLFTCGLQAGLISVWHANISQVVDAVAISMAFLLCGLIALFIRQAMRDRNTVNTKPIGA